jgi:hypothetical protein
MIRLEGAQPAPSEPILITFLADELARPLVSLPDQSGQEAIELHEVGVVAYEQVAGVSRRIAIRGQLNRRRGHSGGRERHET